MSIRAFSLNEIGGRKNVEDAIMPKSFNAQQPKLFIVCDGGWKYLSTGAYTDNLDIAEAAAEKIIYF